MIIASRALVVCCTLMFSFSAFGLFAGGKPLPMFFSAGSYSLWHKNKFETFHTTKVVRLTEKATQAKKYVSERGFDEQYCFLIDMRLPSGKNRFFVYNLQGDSVETEGLVAHGIGSENGNDELIFSNVPNSHSTSLGKYRIGKSYDGNFGLAYKLYGLDITNSNAYDRAVVLHAYVGVPREEVWPSAICTSEGCPSVAPDFLRKLKSYIDHSDRPVMLWIYY